MISDNQEVGFRGLLCRTSLEYFKGSPYLLSQKLKKMPFIVLSRLMKIEENCVHTSYSHVSQSIFRISTFLSAMPAIFNNPFSVALLGLISLDDTSKAKNMTPFTARGRFAGTRQYNEGTRLCSLLITAEPV